MPFPSHRTRRRASAGQSVVEFAVIVPILLVVFLAVADLARIYTAMGTIESAAREAADFGAWNSSYWEGDPADPTSNYAKTVQSMKDRACIASRSLTDYVGPDTSCVNPSVDVQLLPPTPTTDCSDETNTVPCRVKVTLSFDFHLIAPLSLDIFGTHYGFPNQINFQRDSIFAISDFAADTP